MMAQFFCVIVYSTRSADVVQLTPVIARSTDVSFNDVPH